MQPGRSLRFSFPSLPPLLSSFSFFLSSFLPFSSSPPSMEGRAKQPRSADFFVEILPGLRFGVPGKTSGQSSDTGKTYPGPKTCPGRYRVRGASRARCLGDRYPGQPQIHPESFKNRVREKLRPCRNPSMLQVIRVIDHCSERGAFEFFLILVRVADLLPGMAGNVWGTCLDPGRGFPRKLRERSSLGLRSWWEGLWTCLKSWFFLVRVACSSPGGLRRSRGTELKSRKQILGFGARVLRSEQKLGHCGVNS